MNRTHRKTESNPQPDAGILVCCYCETHVPEASAYVVGGNRAACWACCQWHGLPAPHDDVFLPLKNDEGGKDGDQRAGEGEGGDAVALRE